MSGTKENKWNYSEEKGNVYAALKGMALIGVIPFMLVVMATGLNNPVLLVLLSLYACIFPIICMGIHILVRKI